MAPVELLGEDVAHSGLACERPGGGGVERLVEGDEDTRQGLALTYELVDRLDTGRWLNPRVRWALAVLLPLAAIAILAGVFSA